MKPIIGERYRVIVGTDRLIKLWHGQEVEVSSIENDMVYVNTGSEAPWGERRNTTFTVVKTFMRVMELVGGPDENIPEVW